MMTIPNIYKSHLYKAGYIALIAMMSYSQPARSQVINPDDPALRDIDVVEHLGDTIPLDVVIVDETGKDVALGHYFDEGKPVLLIMAYYTCPMLCNLVMNGVVQGAGEISLNPNEDYRILTVSIDPSESAILAAEKKQNYVQSFDREGVAEGWTFFVAAENQSRKLADAIGFKYYYDEDLEQYAHAAVVTVLSGEGVVSRYLYGIEFNPRDLKLALLEASEGKIGSTLDRILLYCYHYDPDAGGYTLFAANVMKLGGLATLVLLAAFLGGLWWWEWRRRSRRLGGIQKANG